MELLCRWIFIKCVVIGEASHYTDYKTDVQLSPNVLKAKLRSDAAPPNEREHEIAKPIAVLREEATSPFNLTIKQAQTSGCSLSRTSAFLVNLNYCSILVNGMYMQSQDKYCGDLTVRVGRGSGVDRGLLATIDGRTSRGQVALWHTTPGDLSKGLVRVQMRWVATTNCRNALQMQEGFLHKPVPESVTYLPSAWRVVSLSAILGCDPWTVLVRST